MQPSQASQALCDIPAEVRPRVVAHLLMRSAFDAETGCINYTGGRTAKGYGRFLIQYDMTNTIRMRAHRATWILAHGPIEDPALVIDHLCYNRACINPEHLDLTDSPENIRRGADRRRGSDRPKVPRPGPTAFVRPKPPRKTPALKPRTPVTERTSCVHGHPWPEHLRWGTSNGKPVPFCAECRRVRREFQKSGDGLSGSCGNCGESIYLTGNRWRHHATRIVACDPLESNGPRRRRAVPTEQVD